jgi:hypothetical protein
VDDARKAFPKIPGVRFPAQVNGLEALDFGPAFTPEGGALTLQPPRIGARYTIYVPKPNEDGLDIAGSHPLETRVPLGTHTGWNVRKEGFRAPSMCPLTGSFIPFATTAQQRKASGDPRKSLEERYGTHEGYVSAVRDAARKLVAERFLLQEDADRYVKDAEASSVLAKTPTTR